MFRRHWSGGCEVILSCRWRLVSESPPRSMCVKFGGMPMELSLAARSFGKSSAAAVTIKSWEGSENLFAVCGRGKTMELNLLPSFEQFCRLSNQGNVVPVYAEIIADRDTPVSAFRKLNEGGPSFLFESTEQNERTGRYSFLGFHPRLVMRSDGD